MFSHPPAGPPVPPGPSAGVPGDPAQDARWRAATAGWRPSSIWSVDHDRTWAWVRYAWEDLLAPAAAEDDAGSAGGGLTGGPDRRVEDLLTVAALFAVQQRFLDVGGPEDPDTMEIPDPRHDGAPLGDDELLAVLGANRQLDPDGAEEDAEGFAAVVAACLQADLMERSDGILGRLVARHGPTQVFAELWSLGHAGGLDPAEDGADPFPLPTDDVAWIVSGGLIPEKHMAWEWLTR